MADLGELKVKVGADISGLVEGVNKAETVIEKLKVANIQLSGEIKQQTTEFNRNEKQLSSLTAAQKLAFNTSSDYYNGLKNKIAGLTETNGRLSVSIADGKNVLKQSTDAVKAQTAALKSGEGATTSFAGGLTKAYSALRTLANIIPGIGIGGLVALIAGPLVQAFEKLGEAVNPFLNAQRALNVALAEAGGSVAGEVVQLNSLVAIAKDTSLSYATRTQAIKELNKEYPGFNKNINLENINTAAVTATIDKEIESIKRRAKVKSLEKLIDEETAKLEKTKAEGLAGQSNALERFIDKTATLLGAPGLGSNVSGQLDDFVTSIKDSEAKIEVFSKKLQELNTEGAKTGTLFVDTGKKGKAAAKEIETIEDVLKKLNIQIDFLNNKQIILKTDEAKAKISAIESTIDHLLQKFKLTTDNPIILNLEAKIKDIELTDQFNKVFKLSRKGKINIPVEFQIDALPKDIKLPNNFDELLRQDMLRALKKHGITHAITTGLVLTDSSSADEVAKTFDTIKKRAEDLQKFTTNLLTPAFNTLFDSILSGSQTAFKGFGEALDKTIKSLIVAALKAAALAGILSLLPGSAQFGTIFHKLFGFANGGLIKGFATGGEIKGAGHGTSDSIVARVSRGEYIIKESVVKKLGVGFFDKLNYGMRPPNFDDFMRGKGIPRFAGGGFVSPALVSNSLSGIGITGGNSIRVEVVGKLRGNDIFIANSRAAATINRNG